MPVYKQILMNILLKSIQYELYRCFKLGTEEIIVRSICDITKGTEALGYFIFIAKRMWGSDDRFLCIICSTSHSCVLCYLLSIVPTAPFTAPCNNRSGYQFVIGDGTGTFTRQQASEACRRMSASLSPFPPLEVDRRRVLDQCIKPHIRQYVQALSIDVNVWTTGCDRADGHCWQWNLHLNPASGQKDSYQKQRPENRTSVHYAVCNGG